LRKNVIFVIMCSIFVLFSGCAVKVGVDTNKTLSKDYDLQAFKNALTHGDWLVARGIHETDNFIAGVTNMLLFHAAIYDMENDEVIEANGSGVHTTALKDFLSKSQRVMVIAPIWANGQTRVAAVKRAKNQIGLNYNYTGLIGLDTPNSFYCTQLAIDAYKEAIDTNPPQNPLPKVVKPGQMYHWGRIIYDSGALN
jgi:hypothetical protein